MPIFMLDMLAFWKRNSEGSKHHVAVLQEQTKYDLSTKETAATPCPYWKPQQNNYHPTWRPFPNKIVGLLSNSQMPNLTQALQHSQESIACVNRKCNHLSFPMIHEKCEVSQFTKRPPQSYMKSVNFPNWGCSFFTENQHWSVFTSHHTL